MSGFRNLFGATAISASGMSAERFRMEVIANNIANANSTQGPDGKPFRREEVIFAEVLDQATGRSNASGLKGVEVIGTVKDESEGMKLFIPGHPHADEKGWVTMPNVQLPIEMVNLLSASRAYEANVRTAQTFRQMSEQALVLLRG